MCYPSDLTDNEWELIEPLLSMDSAAAAAVGAIVSTGMSLCDKGPMVRALPKLEPVSQGHHESRWLIAAAWGGVA